MAEFLFVHYQGNSTPRNSALERQKHEFTQRTYHRKKRLAAVERLKSSSIVLRQRLPLAYMTSTNTSGPDRADPGRPEANRQYGSESRAATVDTDNQEFRQFFTMATSGSPKALLGQGFIDPFSTTAFPMTEFMNSYFHQLRNFTIPSAYPLDKSRMSIWWWQQALSQPIIQLALLFSAAGHQIAMNALHNAPSRQSQASAREYFRIQGDMIKILNELLRDPATAKSTILIVGSLKAMEAIGGNIEATVAHTKGLDVLIQLNGGLEALDHMTLSKIYHGDMMRAALLNTLPALPLISTWRSEILQEREVFYSTRSFMAHLGDNCKTTSQISLLGTSFFTAPWYLGLEDSMKMSLHMSQRLLQYYEVARIQPSIIMPTDNDLFLLLEHRLMSIRYTSNLSVSCTVSCLLNEPLRIILFIYLNMRVWHFQIFPIMQCLLNPLQQSLAIPVLARIRLSAPDVLFWILFTSSMASRGHDGHSWFVTQLAESAVHLGIHDWAAAREILRGFFYMDQPGQPEGEELWKRVVPASAIEDIKYE